MKKELVLIKEKFSDLRKRYGDLLIELKRNKIPEMEWHKFISNEFKEEEISFLFGQNIWKFVDRKDAIIDLDKGTKVKIRNSSSELIISPEKAGIITWICTDGYMSLHRGYYISITDDDIQVFDYFKNLIENVYGKVHFGIRKIKNKNAFQCRFCSKDIFRDLITYIPLNFSKNWTIPIEYLENNAKKEVLRILTHAEGSPYKSSRNRAIEITLANQNVLVQAQSLFNELGINTSRIRDDFSGGWKRHKFAISGRNNLEAFRKHIHFIPNTNKYRKFENIINGYKEHHHQNGSCSKIIFEQIKNKPLSEGKELIELTRLHRSSVSRNLKKLRNIGAIDYKKGKGNSRHWFAMFH